jgi:imidazole glycerol-phosphate synthase subunit HisH
MKIVMIDYGIGNLRSVRKALEKVGAAVIQTDDPAMIGRGDKVVLPGVGAFKDGMQGLQQRGLMPAINEAVSQKIPLLGICLGMQLFFTASTEMGDSAGLSFISGEVRKFSVDLLKIPHTGWNQLMITNHSPLFEGLSNSAYVYFNHSYYCSPAESDVAVANTDYGISFASAIQFGSIYGVQFHPEKSQDAGLQILRNFVELCE